MNHSVHSNIVNSSSLTKSSFNNTILNNPNPTATNQNPVSKPNPFKTNQNSILIPGALTINNGLNTGLSNSLRPSFLSVSNDRAIIDSFLKPAAKNNTSKN